ncbi:MAG: hypothetical protein HXX13_16695 [Bacteroidetes bacterium]|nr:hypothetical protein [Bacteroidota bacterium]
MILLQPGKIYHIYNRGINKCALFYSKENYRYFLRLYDKYIDPIADTYAWALLGNHFHLLVRIKEDSEVNLNALPIPTNAPETGYHAVLRKPHFYFSDFFNAYSKAICKQENRSGSLFQRPFRRILVDDPGYFSTLIVYIHNNPVHHGFTDNYKDYPWSSYRTILSFKSCRLQRERVIGWFDGRGAFISQHEQILPYELFEKYVIE